MFSNQARYVFIFVLFIMWFRNQTYKKAVISSIMSVSSSLVIHSIIKLFYFKPRPFVNHRVGILIPSKIDSSFPSKHTLLAFTASTSMFLYSRVLGSIMGVIALFTSVSRIWVGHHYPTDILGSALLGSITSIFIDRVWRKRRHQTSICKSIN